MSCRNHPESRSRRGSTLLLSLLLIVVLSATVSAAFSLVGSERRAIEDHEAATDAYNMARAAFDQFIASPRSALPAFTPPAFAGPDSAYVSFNDGYAYVSVQRIRPAMDGNGALYLVRSRAVRTAYRPPSAPVAERVFAQYAHWQAGTMKALAAWTSLSGLLKNGGSGTISGVDACGEGEDVAGVAVPNVPGYQQNGGSSVPEGDPDILNMGTQPQANTMITVDWAGIVAGHALTPDVRIPGAGWPGFTSSSYWPVIYVDQAAEWSLPSSGRGLLVVRNDMVINGSRSWGGILLVGGRLRSDGNNTVKGAVITGLNELLGQNVAASDLGNGTKTFRYDSCNIANAAARFGGLSVMRNTAADNWPSY